MARITREGLEACMAFGTASLAVAEIGKSVTGQLPDGLAKELLAELEAAHHRLRDHFDHREDAAVHAMALSILVIADLTGEAIREERDRPRSMTSSDFHFLPMNLRFRRRAFLRGPPAAGSSARPTSRRPSGRGLEQCVRISSTKIKQIHLRANPRALKRLLAMVIIR